MKVRNIENQNTIIKTISLGIGTVYAGIGSKQTKNIAITLGIQLHERGMFLAKQLDV